MQITNSKVFISKKPKRSKYSAPKSKGNYDCLSYIGKAITLVNLNNAWFTNSSYGYCPKNELNNKICDSLIELNNKTTLSCGVLYEKIIIMIIYPDNRI